MGLLWNATLLASVAILGALICRYSGCCHRNKVVLESTGWFGQGKARKDDTKLEPFTVHVPDGVLSDLRQRLENARISHEPLEDSPDFEYGFNSNYLKKVRDHWLNSFDWRKQEGILNAYPQFRTEIEGLKVHYIHAKPQDGKYKKVLPLLIVHGWPGNIFEFYKILPILVDPKQHGIDVPFAFEVVAPSIPGYGFSGVPRKKGFNAVVSARVFRKLMERIGHKRFFLQGGDWGSAVTHNIAHFYPESVRGLHLNMLFVFPGSNVRSAVLTLLGSFFPTAVFSRPADHTFSVLSNLVQIVIESGYMHLQATKPDTVGTALNDSPLGLAAYILEKFSTWTNADYRLLEDGGLTKKFTLDELLTIVTIYWTQGNIVNSQRYYKEFFIDPRAWDNMHHYLSVPVGRAHCRNELFDKTPHELLGSIANFTHYGEIRNCGHFAAFEEPKALASDIFTFVRPLA